jgi:hypothetical protein
MAGERIGKRLEKKGRVFELAHALFKTTGDSRTKVKFNQTDAS